MTSCKKVDIDKTPYGTHGWNCMETEEGVFYLSKYLELVIMFVMWS